MNKDIILFISFPPTSFLILGGMRVKNDANLND